MNNRNPVWTKESVTEVAHQYDTRSSFRKIHGGAYQAAYKNGWMDEVCGHMAQPKKPVSYWTKAKVATEATKYASKAAFGNNSHSAYQAARRNGWLDEVCSHMMIDSGAKRAVYALMFADKTAYVGLSSNPEGRLSSHRGNSSNRNVRDLINDGTDYEPVIFDGWYSKGEATVAEQETIATLEADGYTILNVAKVGGLDGTVTHWTREECVKEANKYKTRSAFSNGSAGACLAARKKGWTEACVAHMHTPRDLNSRAVVEARGVQILCPKQHSSVHKQNVNVSGIKVGAGIKFFRLDIEDMDYLDRIGVLELMEAVSLGKESADPMKAYEGTVTAINNDGTATVELSNYDEDSHYEDGLGSVRDVDFEYLFVIS